MVTRLQYLKGINALFVLTCWGHFYFTTFSP